MGTKELEGLKRDELPSIYCRGESKTRTRILRLELKIGSDFITIENTSILFYKSKEMLAFCTSKSCCFFVNRG